jgi:four helix bundle protein
MTDESPESAEKPQDLKSRTTEYAVRVIRMAAALPNLPAGWILGKQVLRSGTAVGAIYRESYRSRSVAESISKLENLLQELEETAYWMELIVESELLSALRLAPLRDETSQLIAIFVTCVKKLKARQNQESAS